MDSYQHVQLLLNGEHQDHSSSLAQAIKNAERLECMVAFAKRSGLGLILKELEECLAAGLEARFAIGLDFYSTEPELLRHLLGLSNEHNLQVYVSNSDYTFHPKIYAMSAGNGCTVLVGSANLTCGGMQNNYEASAWIDDPTGTIMDSVTSHMDDLIACEELVLATKARIDEYERRYLVNQVQHGLARRRVERATMQAGSVAGTLEDILLEMKSDRSESGFQAQKTIRSRNRKAAVRKLVELASMEELDSDTFVGHYDQLIRLFHSGGLHRSKNIVAQSPGTFQVALAAVAQSENLSPSGAYLRLLGHFCNIPGAGVNVMTEILQAIDSKRFAVMNQNAVSGLRLANIHEFPSKPNKKNVNAELYERYCKQAEAVRKELGLSNFLELDALFNYAYWGHNQNIEEDE